MGLETHAPVHAADSYTDRFLRQVLDGLNRYGIRSEWGTAPTDTVGRQ
jgi:hypothetical protein